MRSATSSSSKRRPCRYSSGQHRDVVLEAARPHDQPPQALGTEHQRPTRQLDGDASGRHAHHIGGAAGRAISKAWPMVTGSPTASKAWSTPPPSARPRRATGSPSDASTTSVAPKIRASSSLAGWRSTATIRAGPGDPRALHDVETDAAATDHRDRVARPHARPVEHRADAGQHRAAEQRGPIERHLLGDGDQGVAVHEHLLGQPAQRAHGVEGPVAPAQRCVLRRAADLAAALAQPRLPRRARAARPAELRRAGHHVVAGPHARTRRNRPPPPRPRTRGRAPSAAPPGGGRRARARRCDTARTPPPARRTSSGSGLAMVTSSTTRSPGASARMAARIATPRPASRRRCRRRRRPARRRGTWWWPARCRPRRGCRTRGR